MITLHPAALFDQRTWSAETFGPGFRTGVFRHIEKEVKEAEAHPEDITEWADLLILTFDGAMRAGHHPEDILRAYHVKMVENQERQWPDWRGVPTDQPIEHVR
jgi:hypothetical protein